MRNEKEFLSEYIIDVAAKRLNAVEADDGASYWHKFNGDAQLEKFMGKEGLTNQLIWIRGLGDIEDKEYCDETHVTWYDVRELHCTRSEYQLYVKGNCVMEYASAGDMLVIIRKSSGELEIIVTAEESTGENQLKWLFDLSDCTDTGFTYRNIKVDGDCKIGFAERATLAQSLWL